MPEDTTSLQKEMAKSLPRMQRSGRISKVEPNLATPANSVLEKEKRMMYTQLMETQMLLYISMKHRLRAAITHSPQPHILLKRLHLLTLGLQPEKDDAQLGSRIINWNLILNKFPLHAFEMVFWFSVLCVADVTFGLLPRLKQSMKTQRHRLYVPSHINEQKLCYCEMNFLHWP